MILNFPSPVRTHGSASPVAAHGSKPQPAATGFAEASGKIIDLLKQANSQIDALSESNVRAHGVRPSPSSPIPHITNETLYHVHAMAGILRRSKEHGLRFTVKGIIVEVRYHA